MRRPERVADMLREEITQIVGYELEDPRVQSVTVTDVRVSENLRDASVYVLVEHAAPYVRKQVGFALNLRHTPEIHFIRDTAEERGARVDRLLEQLGQEQGRQNEERTNDECGMMNDE
jgi:ribosome-binding factor A